jgi:hypothetical protein
MLTSKKNHKIRNLFDIKRTPNFFWQHNYQDSRLLYTQGDPVMTKIIALLFLVVFWLWRKDFGEKSTFIRKLTQGVNFINILCLFCTKCFAQLFSYLSNFLAKEYWDKSCSKNVWWSIRIFTLTLHRVFWGLIG